MSFSFMKCFLIFMITKGLGFFMRKERKKGTSSIFVYLSPEEHGKVLADLGKTTCRSLREYARNRLTRQPIAIQFRDQSFDEFTEVGLQVKNKLHLLR